MYVRRLTIRNLRSFNRAETDLVYPGREQADAFEDAQNWPPRLPNVNVFLGVNGSGKSTILDAVALTLLSPLVASSGYRPYALIRRSTRTKIKSAEIEADLVLHDQDVIASQRPTQQKSAKLRSVIERQGDIEFIQSPDSRQSIWETMYDDKSLGFFFVGYGAMRRVEAVSASDLSVRRKQRLLRYERVASLFEDHFALTPLNALLPTWRTQNPGRYRQVVNLVNRLLPKGVRFTAEIEDGDYLFKQGSVSVPFAALSDGYRAYVGWIGDLLHHLCMAAPSGGKLVDATGVVLVDEVDLHIHPAWQRTMIPTLARTLKNLQFIFTTHSPLVVGTLERTNVFNVERKRGFPFISRPTEEVFGLTTDQILRSEVFGLDSTRDPEFTAELALLQRKAVIGEPGKAIQFMRQAALGKAGDSAAGPVKPTPKWLKKFAEG